MNSLRKGLTIVGLGLLIWSLGLIWPELNLMIVLASVVTVALTAGIGGLVFHWWHIHRVQDQANQTRPRHPSRPVAVH